MSVFQDIIKGMADGAEALQANFAKLAKAISAIDDDGTIHFGSVSADNLAVSGTLPDTPWTNVQLRSGYSGTVSYRIKSGIVFIQLDNVTGVSAVGASNWFVQLPSELAPTVYVRKTAAYGSDGAVLLTVNTSGQIYLSANFGYSISASKNITVNFEI
ncbi:hypothetical protein SFC41_02455 [Weissella cibaria]|uniref:hypothetical protein n=1 Tax=Weissella cibaria TaxID=137591 RepID=UPI00398308FB